MKLFNNIITCLCTFALALGLASCGNDSDDSNSGSGSQAAAITLTASTIKDGAEEIAYGSSEIVMTFSTNVTVSPSANVTLNGEKVTPKRGATTKTLVISLSLEPATSYTLNVPAGSIVSSTDATKTTSTFTISFKTMAAPEIGNFDELCDASATNEAKALYDYLRSCYGRKTLSSVVADVNWNHREADKIFNATKKYPAFNCYDFIHIYVPTNNWINYSDITPVTEWAEAGGLVQLMWHFNVPLSKDTKVESNGSGVTCTPSETTFKASNALIAGTWENEWLYSEMDKVADVLLKLQSKKIAALWRPFHEGAGNATLKSGASWGKAWFWWGYEGAETYKKLWVAMYEHFQKKGIHNLIWVWTTQNYNGDKQQYNVDNDWYPGAQYVDIVGRDLYGYNASKNATEYGEISARYPKKMVTLAECGVESNNNIPFSKVTDFWKSGAKWLYFMPWYGSSMPDAAWWKDAMESDDVITRDEVKY